MSEKNWEKGLEVFDAVYGPGTSEMVKPFKASPFNQEIVGNQFANLWGNDAFTIREKRLMVLGATAMLGRQDLVEIQMTEDENAMFQKSVDAVKGLVAACKAIDPSLA